MAYDDSHVNQIAGQTKENGATRAPTQRLVCYANGRFWAFFVYATGAILDRVFSSSPDGVNWDPMTIIRGSRGGSEFSIAVDNEDNLHYVYTYDIDQGGELPKYRKGHLNADGTITWAAGEQEIYFEEKAIFPTICVDSDGYPYVTWKLYHATGVFVAKSSTKNGIWTMEDGYPINLNNTSTSLLPSVVPLTDGKVYVVYAPSGIEGIILGRLWNGTNWEAEEQVAITRIGATYHSKHSVTSVNNDVHVVFLDEYNDIRYVKRTWGVGWGAETVLATGLHETTTPVICGRDHQGETGVICFWLTGSGIEEGYGYYKIYDDIIGWEDTVEWFYDPEMLRSFNDLFVYGILNCAFKENAGIIPIIYRHGLYAVDWFKIHFNYLNKIVLACEDYLNQPECEAAGCYWYNGICHTNLPTCEELNNQADCLAYGCYWYDGSCHSDPQPLECEEYLNQPECEAAGCYWYNGGCHTNLPTCEELNNQTDCLAYGCYWYSNGCHSEPPPLECEDYLNQAECEAANCYWYNNSCHSPLPSCEILDNQTDCLAYGCYWYDESCHSEPPPLECEDYLTPPECTAADCYWYNGSCHSDPPTCEELNNQYDCEAYGCYWYDNSCHSEPPLVCEDYLNQAECEAANCYWYNDSCHSLLPSCELLDNQTDCEAYGCYWYDESCHSEPPPLECEEYLNQAECEAANCYWYNNSCHSNLPTCAILDNQTDCLAYGCYWYDNSCHSEPPPLECEEYLNQPECEAANCYWYAGGCHSESPPGEIDWLWVAVPLAIAAGMGITVILLKKK